MLLDCVWAVKQILNKIHMLQQLICKTCQIQMLSADL